jgi:hypothetical protein
VYWPNEKRWFPGRVTSATTSTAVVRYDDGDTSSVEVGDRWVLESEEGTRRVQRGKVRWGSGTGAWYDVQKRCGRWFYVRGGLEVAKASLNTLICVGELEQDGWKGTADHRARVATEDTQTLVSVGEMEQDGWNVTADHQARVAAEERRRKKREDDARRPTNRCGIDGCEFQFKDKRDLKNHQARVHGIRDMKAAEEGS